MSITPPRDFETLKAMLLERHDLLPKKLKQVAVFALNDPEEVAFGTTAGIAAMADVQPSTLVRFAQTLGYSGFSDLQDVFRLHLRGSRPDYQDRVAMLLAQFNADKSVATLLSGFVQSATQSLERLKSTVTAEGLDEAAALLAKAHTIYILGMRRAFPVSTYLAYAFAKLGIRAVLVDGSGALGLEQLTGAGGNDALIAISFSPYTPDTVALTSRAHAAGMPVLAITDSGFSPLVRLAKTWLEVVEADFCDFRSLAATLALAMTLAVAVAELRAADQP